MDLDLQKVAKLARLRLSPDEAGEFAPQIHSILEHVKSIQSVVLPEGVSSEATVVESHLREDVPSAEMRVVSADSLVEISPGSMNGYFEVPQVVSQ